MHGAHMKTVGHTVNYFSEDITPSHTAALYLSPADTRLQATTAKTLFPDSGTAIQQMWSQFLTRDVACMYKDVFE